MDESGHQVPCPAPCTSINAQALVAFSPLPHFTTTQSFPPHLRTNDPESALVAEAVQHFITAMDSLKLNLVAVDQVRRYHCCRQLGGNNLHGDTSWALGSTVATQQCQVWGYRIHAHMCLAQVLLFGEQVYNTAMNQVSSLAAPLCSCSMLLHADAVALPCHLSLVVHLLKCVVYHRQRCACRSALSSTTS